MKASRRGLVSLGIALVLVFSLLPGAALGADAPGVGTLGDDLVYQSFSEDTSVVANPERGWFRIVDTADISATTLGKFRQTDATTLVMLETNLKDFKTKPLSQAKLNEIGLAFDAARKANLSVIFRAAYDFDGKKKPEPTNLNVITGHISQLSGILHANEDILFSVQAGFLGSWGEWHASYFGDPVSIEAQRAVVSALLKATPTSVTVAVRRPVFVRGLNDGYDLTADEAFSTSDRARIAYHNDAILSDASDMGTYSDKNYSRQAELAWTNNHTKYTPFIAEANAVSSYSNLPSAVDLLDYMNVQSMNRDYNTSVLAKWKKGTYNGQNAYEYIGATLGYRLVLNQVGLSKNAVQGGSLHLQINIENKGFGTVTKAKDFEVVLSQGGQTLRAQINEDVRWISDEAGALVKDYYLSLPADMPAGDWTVSLGLNSTFDTLKGNPAYSIRFANKGIWDSATGLNTVGVVHVGQSNAGGFSRFEQIDKKDTATTPTTPTEPATPTNPTEPTTPTEPAVPTEPTTPTTPVVPTEPSVPAKPTDGLSLTYSGSTLQLQIIGTKLNTKSQFYLNTDNNTATGFRVANDKLGYDYLVENATLYKYSGKNNSWSWTKVTAVPCNKTSTAISVTVPLTSLNISSGAVVPTLFRSNDLKATDRLI